MRQIIVLYLLLTVCTWAIAGCAKSDSSGQSEKTSEISALAEGIRRKGLELNALAEEMDRVATSVAAAESEPKSSECEAKAVASLRRTVDAMERQTVLLRTEIEELLNALHKMEEPAERRSGHTDEQPWQLPSKGQALPGLQTTERTGGAVPMAVNEGLRTKGE